LRERLGSAALTIHLSRRARLAAWSHKPLQFSASLDRGNVSFAGAGALGGVSISLSSTRRATPDALLKGAVRFEIAGGHALGASSRACASI